MKEDQAVFYELHTLYFKLLYEHLDFETIRTLGRFYLAQLRAQKSVRTFLRKCQTLASDTLSRVGNAA